LFRRVERAVRFGGDEFIVIYQDGTDLDEAEEVGSLILELREHRRLRQQGSHYFSCDISRRF
jgi:GGDEF domain-containing protein